MYVPPKCEALTFASSNRAGKFYHAPEATPDSGAEAGGSPEETPRSAMFQDSNFLMMAHRNMTCHTGKPW